MKEIPLTQGRVALVDDEDYEWLSQWKWFAMKAGYAARQQGEKVDGKYRQRLVYMHREILKPPPGFVTDHANGDKLDNRRANLRGATHAGNSYNKGKTLSRSGFKGVFRLGNRWGAQIRAAKKQHYLGCFDTPEEAHAAYCEAAKRLHGEFANPGPTYPEKADRSPLSPTPDPWDGASIMALRKEFRISQVELATFLGMPPVTGGQHISRWEAGRVGVSTAARFKLSEVEAGLRSGELVPPLRTRKVRKDKGTGRTRVIKTPAPPATPPPMPAVTAREWAAEDVTRLAELARRKGIRPGAFAEEWLGVTHVTLNAWQRGKSPTGSAKRLLCYIESELSTLPDQQ